MQITPLCSVHLHEGGTAVLNLADELVHTGTSESVERLSGCRPRRASSGRSDFMLLYNVRRFDSVVTNSSTVLQVQVPQKNPNK